MNPQQIALVKHTWKLLRKVDPVLLGDVFYTKLFTDAPQTRSLFTTPRDVQSRKLIDMINIIVGRLDQFESIQSEIIALGERHVQYGAKPHHYIAVGNALIWTLKQGLGKDWNANVEDAWKACYAILSQSMQQGSKAQ